MHCTGAVSVDPRVLSLALTYKLMANSMILGNLEILAESLTFAEKSGIGSERVLDLVRGMNGFLLVAFSLISHRDFT